MVRQLGVIGCGLMGGSFALALRQARQVQRVVGYSRSSEARQQALSLGVIDVAAENVAQAVTGSDVVLVAVPVAATEETLREVGLHLDSHALCMDVGSTKVQVMEAAERALGPRWDCFVPAHPIAGKELAGVGHADAQLYRDRLVVLTPAANTSAGAVARLDRASGLWRAAGARVEVMTAQAHDAAFAAVSHLPHLLAFAYMKGLMNQSERHEFLRRAGPGFRDFSRIAGSDAVVWRDILLSNSQATLSQLAQFRQALDQFERWLRAGQGSELQGAIEEVATERRRWRLADPAVSATKVQGVET